MNLKKIIPLTFSAASLASIPSVVCSCGNQYQPDYTIRCDTKEITWSLSQTTETEEFLLYTKDKIETIWGTRKITAKNLEGYLRFYDDKTGTGWIVGTKPANPFNDTQKIYFDSLSRNDIPLGKYWLDVYYFWYEDEKHLQHVWFEFNLVE